MPAQRSEFRPKLTCGFVGLLSLKKLEFLEQRELDGQIAIRNGVFSVTQAFIFATCWVFHMNNYATSKSRYLGSKKSLVIVLCLSVFIAGCTSPFARKPLSPELASQKQSLTVYTIIPSDRVAYQLKQKQTGITSPNIGVAIVGAIISSSINAARKSRADNRKRNIMSPLWQSSADFDFRREYWSKLEPTISKSTWFAVTSLEKKSAVTEEEAKKFKMPLLILKTFYDLSSTFQVLSVQTQASLYTTNPVEREFFAIYTYYSDKIGQKTTAITLWAADKAAAFRREARSGIEQNMKMLRHDLLQNPTSKNVENGKKIEFRMRDNATGSILNLEGNLIEESEKRILMRATSGNIFSISTDLKE